MANRYPLTKQLLFLFDRTEKLDRRRQQKQEAQKRYRQKYKDRLAEYHKKYYQNHKIVMDARARAWAQSHKQELAGYQRNYYHENKKTQRQDQRKAKGLPAYPQRAGSKITTAILSKNRALDLTALDLLS
jgi:hypothetical protein